MHDITEGKQAEATRFEREQEFEALVENTPDIVSRYDRKFRHLYVNRAVTQATGLPASAFIGKTHEDLGMPRHLQAEWNAILGDVFASGQERETEFEFPTPGGPRSYHSRLVPEHAPDGRIRSVLNIARDITARKQAETALHETNAELLRLQTELASTLEALHTSYWHIRKINEFLSMCMECGKVNADGETWQAARDFLAASGLTPFVSHGYCPPCTELLMARHDAADVPHE